MDRIVRPWVTAVHKTREETPETARMPVCLAATLDQWFCAGAITNTWPASSGEGTS